MYASSNLRRVKPNIDAAGLAHGGTMISFAGSFINFIVRGHDVSQSQRMTIASSALFSGGGQEAAFFVLCEDLLGGRAHDPTKLIATPTYTYRMILSQRSHAIYREYMPPRAINQDSFDLNDDVFSNYWFGLDARPSRLLTSEREVARVVNSGAIVNALVRAELPGGRSCSLQFPIRYFSVRSGADSRFHAEAGPVLVPAAMLGRPGAEAPENMHIAQIGFNRWREAELAVWEAERSELAASRWFSRICKLRAEFAFLVPEQNRRSAAN